jgi:hypothetical protein
MLAGLQKLQQKLFCPAADRTHLSVCECMPDGYQLFNSAPTGASHKPPQAKGSLQLLQEAHIGARLLRPGSLL